MKLDYLPRWVEIRVHGSAVAAVDYTGTGRPGVFVLEPTNAERLCNIRQRNLSNHPNAARPVLMNGAKLFVPLRSTQIPLAPAGIGTFNNAQGKTARDEEGTPTGLV